jgi:hypothetical protein
MNLLFNRVVLTLTIATLVTASTPCSLGAQQREATVSLLAVQFGLDRLAPGKTVGQAVFSIDEADSITVEIIATIRGLITSIEGPNGDVLDENTIGNFGGEFSSFEGTLGPDSPLILSLSSPGFHFLYIFPLLGPGKYTVHFEADPGLAEEVPVITQVLTNSPIVAALFVTEPLLTFGNSAVITAAIFDEEAPVVGANVSVVIRTDTGHPVTLTLFDNGSDADDAAGDGLYSAEFDPSLPGKYEAVAKINGLTTSGSSFFRESATRFTVVAPSGSLTETVEDRSVDDNNNGLFDRVVVDVEVDAAQAGDYRVFVHLKSAGGQNLVRGVATNLSVGLQNAGVDFEAASLLQELGENGPYNIELIELIFVGSEGAIPSDRLLNVGQTQTYQLSQFERPSIRLTGITSDSGIDTNNNSLFDILRANIGVDLLAGGFYQWSARLVDSNNTEIALASNWGSLGIGVNTINLSFDGRKIGEHGVNGPYFVKDLLIFGVGRSLVARDAARTQTYNVRNFEGAPQNQPPVAICQNVTAPTDPGACTASASVNNGSFDPDGDPITLVQTPAGPYNLGTTSVILTVADNNGASNSCAATVAVMDQELPALTCPSSQTAECTEPNGAAVSFSATAGDNCSGVIFLSCAPPAGSTFTLGVTADTCIATDNAGNKSTCNFTVKVVDTTPPVMGIVTATPNVLWPPNHRMMPVSVSVFVTDICDAAPICKIVSVSSNEPVDGLGDGDTAPDWEITGNLTVNFRAERAGKRNGRVYTNTITCIDASGNSSTKAVAVTVPHDRGK